MPPGTLKLLALVTILVHSACPGSGPAATDAATDAVRPGDASTELRPGDAPPPGDSGPPPADLARADTTRDGKPPTPDKAPAPACGASCCGQPVDCSATLQACINATPTGGVLELPACRLSLAAQLQVGKPMTIRTAGKAGAPPCPQSGGGCAELFALPGLAQPLGLIVVKAAATLDHLVLDGNRQGRASGPAAAKCTATPMENAYGYNGAYACSDCAFTNSVSRYALCGTGLEVQKGSNITVTGSTFAWNGRHNQKQLWADGLTVHDAPDSTFSSNTFLDNTDVDLIFGGCPRCKIQNNTINHSGDVAGGAFVALMIQKWPSTSGHYADVEVSGNQVDCGPARACGSGIYVGSESWYPETPYGTLSGGASGAIRNNAVVNAMNGLYIAAQGLFIYKNGVLNAHGIQIPNSCKKSLVSVTPYVVSPTAKAIDFNGENVDPTMKIHFSNANWSGCIPNWPF